jgi:transcriptional regulator with XRE-family HTH domain
MAAILDKKRLRRLREAKGLSQQALATAAGLSVSSVTKMEASGKNAVLYPTPETLAALAKALGVDCNALITTVADERSVPML